MSDRAPSKRAAAAPAVKPAALHPPLAHAPRRRLLPAPVRGVLASVLLGANTLFWCFTLFAFALLKLLFPFDGVRRVVDRILNAIATRWIAGNSGWMKLVGDTQWDVAGVDELKYGGWYLVNCTHQSWVDILVLQHVLNRRIPLLKFFLKHQLIYVPVIGLAWWALDFPFMRRHSSAYLRRHPEKRHDDLETTRRACRKFALVPTSVMNFAEGTRFTPAKHRAQRSPYRHLLKPKAGALALALDVLGDRFDALLDVTIVYPAGIPTFWDLLCGNVPAVVLRAQRQSIPADLRRGNYVGDPVYRHAFQHWLQSLWEEKDARIDALLAGRERAPRAG